uniref:Uncharacterized protein n=1 Tax=Lotus japonicus TaxID=34305 RepID=I3SZH6_LOTJA|nr:unknown [Lotus japonicus]
MVTFTQKDTAKYQLPNENDSKKNKKSNQQKQILQNTVLLLLHLTCCRLRKTLRAPYSIKRIRPKGVTRGCPVDCGVLEAVEVNVEQRRDKAAKSSGKSAVSNPGCCHGNETSHESKPITPKRVGSTGRRRGRRGLWPLTRRASRDLHSRIRFSPGIGRCFAPPVKRNQFFLLNEGFADRALLRLGVMMKPPIKARPAEEVTTESDHWVLSQFKAYIAFKITSIVRTVPRARCARSRSR